MKKILTIGIIFIATIVTVIVISSSRLTLAKVAEHNSSESCWTAINGEVYDLTEWIAEHPGGIDAILGLCGKDGSLAFNNQHGEQPNPAAAMLNFRIGKLVE